MFRAGQFHRALVCLALCGAMVAASSLGVHRGMTLHIDEDGRFALESLAELHAHEHAHGADHSHHDFAHDADHGALHVELTNGADPSGVPQPASEQSRSIRLLHLPVHVALLSSTLPPGPSRPFASTERAATRGAGARSDLTSLRAIILLV